MTQIDLFKIIYIWLEYLMPYNCVQTNDYRQISAIKKCNQTLNMLLGLQLNIYIWIKPNQDIH